MLNSSITNLSKLKTAGDHRNDNTAPNDYSNTLEFKGLKYNNKIGMTATGTGTYSYLLGLRGWTDNSGGPSNQFAFNARGVFHRKSENVNSPTAAWQSWYRIVQSSDIGSFVYFDDVTANYVNINANSYGEFQYSTTKLGLPSGASLMGFTVICDRNKNFVVQAVSSGSGYWTFRFSNFTASTQKIGGLVLIGTYIKTS